MAKKKLGLPALLLITIGIALVTGPLMPTWLVNMFITFSSNFKNLLTACLPYMVFSFVAQGIIAFQQGTSGMLMLLLCTITISNLLATFVSYLAGMTLSATINTSDAIITGVQSQVPYPVTPYIIYDIPVVISSEKALLLGLFVGLVLSYRQTRCPYALQLAHLVTRLKIGIEYCLQTYFIPILPLYLFGFLLKLAHEGIFFTLFSTYGTMFCTIIITQYVYVFIMYFFAARGCWSTLFSLIRQSLGAYITAFSTMSSTAAVPITTGVIASITQRSAFAQVVTPILANVHMVGDAIAIPIISLVSIKLFLGTMPSLWLYVQFIFYFCTMLFASSGVPGGGIIIMLPFLKSVFMFTPEMTSLAITLHLLQDSFGTASNVVGDIALAVINNKIIKK